MHDVEYHIHVNALREELSDLRDTLLGLGYTYKPATIWTSGFPEYLGLYSLRPATHEDRDRFFEVALEVVRAHPTFYGYVESESVAPNLVCKIPPRAFTGDVEKLSIPIPNMAARSKMADVHIYLPLDSADIGLCQYLVRHHFYEVRTSTKKIFTLEAESMADAKCVYAILAGFFGNAGGAIEVECESVGRLEASTADFPFRKVAERGFSEHVSSSKVG